MNTLYIVENGRWDTGDIAGSLMTPEGETVYSHVSSSQGWLVADLTVNFGRKAELDSRFPDGWSTEYVGGSDPLPAVLVPFFDTDDEDVTK